MINNGAATIFIINIEAVSPLLKIEAAITNTEEKSTKISVDTKRKL